MSYSAASGSDLEGPVGYTYSAVLVSVSGPDGDSDGGPDAGPDAGPDGGSPADGVLATLRRLRFSGWVSPPENGWVVAVPAAGDGTVAAAGRGVVDVAEELAAPDAPDPGLPDPALPETAPPRTVLAVRVRADRQLVLVAWSRGTEVARYVSDPSREPGADKMVLPDPVGAEDAAAIAEACGRPEAGEQLEELLGEEFDPDSDIESERLGRVLRLLGLPTWVVAVSSLPRNIPTGPRTRDLTRLGAGYPGPLGLVCGRAADVVRRHRRPPAVLDELPRMEPGMDDPWLY